MKNHDIEHQLVAAAPDHSGVDKKFVSKTMQRVRLTAQHETFTSAKRRTGAQFKWSTFMKLARTHKIVFALTALIITSIVTFSGYAYATGTDPISLIRRWIEGDMVKVDYSGRKFEYGVARNYSDAAITAYAELGTTDIAHFYAANRLQIPHSGVEHVTDPVASRTYAAPTLVYIQTANDSEITIKKVYLRGDKMTSSKDISETVTISEDDIFYYHELKQAAASDGTGKLVALYQDSYLRHKIGSNQTAPVTAYFAFELSHPLQDYRDADAALREEKPAQGSRWTPDDVMPLIERELGALSNICMNNGADTCNPREIGYTDRGMSLYGKTTDTPGHTYGLSNPDAIAYGEGAPDNAKPVDIISRNIEGKVVELARDEIVIKSSSGALWYLEFSPAKRAAFKQTWGKDLQLGMTIGGTLTEHINDLDNRHIQDKYILTARVY